MLVLGIVFIVAGLAVLIWSRALVSCGQKNSSEYKLSRAIFGCWLTAVILAEENGRQTNKEFRETIAV